MRAGLIPSRALQEHRIIKARLQREKTASSDNISENLWRFCVWFEDEICFEK